MVKRRKFLIGIGALAAGSGAAMGTGAFSSASIPDRSVTAKVNEDHNSTIALVAGDDKDISISESGELHLDLTGQNEEGVNINSRYTWGDHDNPADDYAFKIVNNDDTAYDDLALSYDVEDDSWIDNSTTYSNESFIKFTAYGSGDPDNYWGSMKCPNNALGTPNPNSQNLPTSSAVDFEVGQEMFIVVDIDTTGSLATTDDDLTGTLSVDVSGPGGA